MAAKLFLTFLALVVGMKMSASKTIDQMIEDAIDSPDGYNLINIMPGGTIAIRTELDIMTELDDIIAESERNTRRGKRKATSDLNKRWPKGPIRYKYSGISNEDIQVVQESIACWEKFTCLDFQRDDSIAAGDYIVFTSGSGCSSFVGRQGGEQAITLGTGCFFKSVVIHEIGHAIGWEHEQSRPDRDNFVTIHLDQVEIDKRGNYDIANDADCLGVPYDYTSIMHYGDGFFAIGNDPTITTNDPAFQDIIGTADQFSFYDIKLANLMYMCPQCNNCPIRTCLCGGFQASDCNCYCKGNPITPCNEIASCDDTTTTTPQPPTTTTVKTTPKSTPCPQRRQADSCVDAGKNCKRRAKGGACVSKRDKMLKDCRKTCNFCGVASVPQKPKSDVKCVDSNRNCQRLSQNDGCKKYRPFMITTCAKTCGFCRALRNPASQCMDRQDECSKVAALCKIESQVELMKAWCPKTCGFCSNTTVG